MSQQNNIAARVRYSMSVYSDCSFQDIPLDARFKEDLKHPLGYSDLSFQEFLMVLEEEFDLELTAEHDYKIKELNSAQKIATFIQETQLKAQSEQ